MNSKKFVHLDENENPWAIVSTEQLWGKIYAIKYNRPEKRLGKNFWRKLFADAKEAGREFGADVLVSRTLSGYEPEVFRDILAELGFKKHSERVEYKTDVASLPNEEGSPFRWQTMKELAWSSECLATFVGEVTKGALDIEPDEKPEDFIQDWLRHDELTSGPQCIAIGFLDERPCAFVVAQVIQKTGWSRLSYLGLIPEFRGKGLSKWVHRHGFKMMKDQGGKLYHGGTHAANRPMRNLFEQHGCKVYSEMEEWVANLKEPGSDVGPS